MDENTFQQSVLIAAAFIQNGDVRVEGKFGAPSGAMDKIQDIIKASYQTILEVRAEIEKKDVY